MLTLKMAWRNLWRHSRRTLLTVTAVGLGLAILITLISFTIGMFEMMVDQIASSSFGHIQVHHPAYLEHRSAGLVMNDGDNLVATIRRVPGVKAVSPRLLFSGAATSSRSSAIQPVSVTAVDPTLERELSTVAGKIVSGEFLGTPEGADDPDAPARIRARRGITIGSGLAELLKVDVGSRIRLDTAAIGGGTTSSALYVTGLLHTGTDSIDKNQVWIRLQDMQEISGARDVLNEIAVVADNSEIVESVANTIRQALPERTGADAAPGSAVSVMTWWEVSPELKQTLDISSSWTSVLNLLMLIILSAGILTTMYMVIFERSREFGVRLALGATPGELFSGLMVEALMISGLACTLGLIAGAVLVSLLVNVGVDLSWLVGGIDFAGLYIENVYRGSTAPRVFIEPTVTVFIGTILIALWPSLKVARMKAVDAIKQGGST